ncbi:hypothetical protein LINGRAHAP2_LOCUS28808, partial [Linum grandiflorum]
HTVTVSSPILSTPSESRRRRRCRCRRRPPEVSSFPPLRDDHQSPSTNFVNSFSQFKRWPSHAAPPPDPDHPLHKSSSAPVFQENQIGELRSYRSAAAGGDLNEIRISDGEKLAAAAAANLGYTNSFTKDRMLKMGALPPSPSPSPSPSTSPPLNPFRTVSDSSSSSESAAVTTPKSKTHVVIGGITCPMVRKLSLVRHRSSSLKEKVSFIKT